MSAPASSSWVFSFEIPGRFTNKTMKCLEDVCISSTARSEIIGSLHTRMLQYTDFPSPFEYRASCRRLVEKYPCLVDKTESGYVSNTYTIASNYCWWKWSYYQVYAYVQLLRMTYRSHCTFRSFRLMFGLYIIIIITIIIATVLWNHNNILSMNKKDHNVWICPL